MTELREIIALGMVHADNEDMDEWGDLYLFRADNALAAIKEAGLVV